MRTFKIECMRVKVHFLIKVSIALYLSSKFLSELEAFLDFFFIGNPFNC